MERVMFTCFVVCGLLYTAQGIPLTISSKFMNGDVLFLWDGSLAQEYDIAITRDKTTSAWDRQAVIQYTVKDALLYDSISIIVRLSGDGTDNKMTYSVSKVESDVGDSVSISWTAPFFPRAGDYTIYHTGNVNRSIISVDSSGATLDETKYEYQSRPFNSTNIVFNIMNITREDAGYYNGGTKADAAWSGGGVVLIVHDKPSKPKIKGNIDIVVGNSSELTCSSNSTTAPDYYARLRPLSYTWYVNNTKLTETRETLMLRVFKDHKYSGYSCTARDKLESDRSDHVRINPLYPPDKLKILPEPQPKVTVKEGEIIGPYTCTADCNPPCNITWKYKDSTSGFFDAASTGLLDRQIVNRSIALYRCIAKYPSVMDVKESIKLDVLYLDEPLVTINGSSYSNEAVQAQERTSLHISCNVSGNPNPSIRLRRSGSTDILTETSTSEVLNHSITRLQCYDTGNYTCTGQSTGFDSKQKIFGLNVNYIPQPPKNFTAYSYAPGFINLTWLSGFNGGPEQHFLLFRKEGSDWETVKNLTDPGEGRIGHFDPGPLSEGQIYWFRLNSCNRINCSVQSIDVQITVSATEPLGQSSDNSTFILIGVLIGVVIIILVVAAVVARLFLRKKKTEKRRESVQVMVDDTTQPDVVLYAAVDKSFLEKKRNKADVVTHDENKDKRVEEKGNLIPNPNAATKGKRKKKDMKKTAPEVDDSQTEAMYGNTTTRQLNQDGLIYIDVDFGNKAETLDPSGKPKIHGDEERTEYTFVDFSKKAPPVQESPEDDEK
ncbi:neural cell adhesion molecule 2-like [Crassostrea virginica]